MAGVAGLIVNPVAGAGGRVGLHGTDGQEVLAEAVRRGGAGTSTPRAVRALRRMAESPDRPSIIAAPGVMGADVAAAGGFPVTALDLRLPTGGVTTAADTREAARQLADAGVELLLFGGGDGTARDVALAVGTAVPILGIPAGVKMRSGVFGTSPEAAGELATEYLSAARSRISAEAEILDLAADGLHSEFYAVARVPATTAGKLAGPKSFGMTGPAVDLDALCAATAKDLEPGTLYLFGPGSTTGRVLSHLEIEGTALGVDAVLDGKLIGADLPEQSIVDLMDAAQSTKLVLGVIGGQGFLLGRGNQQLGPAVLDRIAPGDLVIIASAAKLAVLDRPRLLIDVGDEVPFRGLRGYHRVRTGPARYMMMQVTTGA